MEMTSNNDESMLRYEIESLELENDRLEREIADLYHKIGELEEKICDLEDDNSEWKQDLRNAKAKHTVTHEELRKAFKWIEDVWVFKETRAIRNEEELRAMREWLDKNFPRKDGRPRKSFIKVSDK